MKSDSKPDVAVIGLGYIGLPTAAIIARSGCKVLGVDISSHVVETINRGEIHIEEVDLDGLRERWGGVEKYLTGHAGLAPETLDRLRSNLLD